MSRLKAAGAIVVGKTNAPEFGAPAYTKNRIYGVTRSPWNLELTPGGSSGGSSAAMAAAVLPLVTAGDGGGSIRIPASFTGCFGLKTSYGRIPREPEGHQWEYGTTAVYGPLTKTVDDAALFMDQVVGPDAIDPYSLPHPGCSYVDRLSETTPALRIGFSPDLGYAVVQSDVAAAVEDAVQVFARLGHRVDRAAGGPPELGRAWGLLGAFLLGARLREDLAGREHLVGRGLLAGFQHRRDDDPGAVGRVRRACAADLNAWCAEQFDRFDLLVTPTVPFDPYPAPGPYPTEIEGRALAVVQRRVVHHPVQPVVASGRHGARRSLPRRAAHGHADRRPAPPRRPGAPGRPRLRARASLASALAPHVVTRAWQEDVGFARHTRAGRFPATLSGEDE